MKTIPPSELSELIEVQPGLTLLDVRTSAEFAEVHLPQARNVPLDVLAPKALVRSGIVPANEPVYLICGTGARAVKAATKFAQSGLENTVVLEGGTLAWEQAGFPVERGPARTMSLERQVRIGAGVLVLTGIMLARLVHPWLIGLSAFIGAGLVFAGITDFCGMGLLLAKLPWNNRQSL